MGKTDPRILKTRRKLKESFLTLLATQRLGEINIKDLTETAEITRGTFYLHYKDKESYIHVMMLELIDECFKSVIHSLEQADQDEQEEHLMQPTFSLVHLFEYVSERPAFFKVLLLDETGSSYQPYFNQKLANYMIEHQKFSELGRQSRVPQELISSFLSYSILGYIVNWLDNGQMYAHRFMAQNLAKLLNSELMNEAGLEHFFVLEGIPATVSQTAKTK